MGKHIQIYVGERLRPAIKQLAHEMRESKFNNPDRANPSLSEAFRDFAVHTLMPRYGVTPPEKENKDAE